MEHGTVVEFNKDKGFGFIELTDGTQVFVHYSVIESENFKTLEVGEKVDLLVAEGKRGMQAVRVLRKEEQDEL
ncbi:cold-shock protein [Pediococcus argentinicus]|uniref:CSD domain-containing protein n=1 Tax=Pediococcus argentinicus TaxID=480391 RepID=A0A0R2NL61_9LACO|nr:cold shock domain-containing protein [Pediococcus argentinicus]KRO25570.1 hypothetical protein IV88_GL001650 [Pediococcus argentinicus]NKZ22096.1 cold shock domain-containing protein [Pediococcus argentinicus]GEP20086.1 cold-shock protein [Pediococcus argentinicus]